MRRFRPIVGANNPPIVKASAGPLSGATPLVVSFSASGSSDPDGQPIQYEWDFGDGGSSSEESPVHVYTTVGTFTAKVTVKETSAPFASLSKSFVIRTGVNPPVAFIDTPDTSVRYEIGKPVNFSGHTTPSTGVSMSWSILQRHNLHEHLVAEVSGASGSFIPEEHCDNCSYELCLMAQGQGDIIDQKCLPVPPRTSAYTFASVPPGATITYIDEEKEVLAPYVAQPIVGSRQTVSAALIANGRTFSRWADGSRDPVKTFVTGSEDQSLVAIYVNMPPKIGVGLVRARFVKGRMIKLDASRSQDPEGEPLRYIWKFSDKKIMRGASVSRAFKRAGTYAVTLIVRDRLGANALYRGTIKVGKGVSLRQVALSKSVTAMTSYNDEES